MLRDRKLLLEEEVVKLKQACGHLYFKIATSGGTESEKSVYDTMRTELANLTTDLTVVDQMLADGHK